jgi:hypothetical protein
MQNLGKRSAGLARPVAALGVVATLVVLFHGDGHDPTPALPMGALAIASAFLRGRAVRILLVPLLCIAAFAIFSTFAHVSFSDRGMYWSLLYVRLVEGACFAVLLAPLVLSSTRAGSARPATLVDRSQRRSPWIVAAGTAALFGELSSAFYCGWLLVADRGKPFRSSQWEQGVSLLYGIAVACALGLALADVWDLVRLMRTGRWVRHGLASSGSQDPFIDVGVGDETIEIPIAPSVLGTTGSKDIIRGSPRRALRPLLLSLGIDVVAVVAAIATARHRFLAPPE